MTEAQLTIEAALHEVEKLRQLLRKGKSKQVSAEDDRRVVKATALSWFNNHRVELSSFLDADLVETVDSKYQTLLAAAERATLRTRYLEVLKSLKSSLAQLRSEHIVALSALPAIPQSSPDSPPQFAPLVLDVSMQRILQNRWEECVKCVNAEAPLAATVMMGGLLEGLLLARVNQLSDKTPVTRAKAAPLDKKTGKTLNLSEWTLANYLAVAHELGWISPATKDVGGVMREYRNYIHPQKEFSHGVTVSPDDAKTLWEVAKSVARQVLKP